MNPNAANTRPTAPLFWIATLRIVVGVMFLTTWLPNFLDGVYTAEGLQRFFTQQYPQSENALAFYANFIDNVILPARQAFAPFQLVAELLLGLAILAGFSRLSPPSSASSSCSTPCSPPGGTIGSGRTYCPSASCWWSCSPTPGAPWVWMRCSSSALASAISCSGSPRLACRGQGGI